MDNPANSQRRRWILGAMCAVAGAALTGCGQKGPLYLPEEKLEELKKKRRSSEAPRRDVSSDSLV